VSGGGDRTVRIWDAETGRLQQTLRGHPAWVLSAVHSTSYDPAGTRIASAGDASIQLWEATAVLRGHRDWVRALAFTPDGEHTITASGTDLKL
jgi:WD40 repeat protein